MRLSLLVLLVACSDDKGMVCGEGTHAEGGTCVAEEGAGDTGADTDTDSDSDTDTDTDADTDTNSDTDTDTDSDTTPTARRVIGYYTEWSIYDRDYQVADIPADKLTHINYAFADLSSDGSCAVYDSWAALERDGGTYAAMEALKDINPDLKVLLSVGGWTLSSNFSSVASTEAGRAAFAERCVAFAMTYGFDGLDIDWEYPVSGGLSGGTAADTENYTLLLAAVRAEMDATDPSMLLTIAAPAGDDKIVNLDISGMEPYLDWLNVMAYDFYGGWDGTTNFHAPLYKPPESTAERAETYNVHAAVQAYLDGGLPSDKIVVGLPFYGRGWSGVAATDDGLYQSGSSAGTGTWEAGVFDYGDLVDNYLTDPSFERHYDEDAAAPWLYSADDRVFITYDDEQSLGAKLDYVEANDLGGVMAWELSADTDDHALISLLAARLIP